jgi:hypothetical protein
MPHTNNVMFMNFARGAFGVMLILRQNGNPHPLAGELVGASDNFLPGALDLHE